MRGKWFFLMKSTASAASRSAPVPVAAPQGDIAVQELALVGGQAVAARTNSSGSSSGTRSSWPLMMAQARVQARATLIML